MAKKKITNEQVEEKMKGGIFNLTQERNDFLLPYIIDMVAKKERGIIAEDYQKKIYRTRNSIAHIGYSADATPGVLKDILKFIKPFSASISNDISLEITKRYF